MNKSNKERVEEKLKELTNEFMNDFNFKGITTIDISDRLIMRRNIVSQYLNELVEENKAIKTKTRPVLFKYNISNKRSNQEIVCIKEKDSFKDLVGYNGSLRSIVQKCKAIVSYPSRDMSILITGNSGVGKSYMASLLHNYAKDEGKISKEAPYVIFNCADYADNPELLSANLFGYIKGSFTGADKNHAGALESADGGCLFLDEVHRLSPEGQEKLFVFMDKGVFKRLGENKAERKVEVKLILATTEDPQKALLQTFIRRVALKINIPRLDERPMDERLTMIYKFFRMEALKINKDIAINKQVINSILSQKNEGNVGSLKNIIRFCCAIAYKEQQLNDVIKIEKVYLKLYGLNLNSNIKEYYFDEYMSVKKENNDINDFTLFNNDKLKMLDSMIDNVENIIKAYDEKLITINELRKKLAVELNKILEEVVYEEKDDNDFVKGIYLEGVENTLKIIESQYGIKYYGNTSKVLSKVLLYYRNSIIDTDDAIIHKKFETIKNIIKKQLSKSFIVSEKIIKNLENSLDNILDIRVQIMIFMYVLTVMSKESEKTNAIIVAHGYSTASSIASVANQLYGEFIFEAFDMPIDLPAQEIKNKIKAYISETETAKDTIILVDMGSLININSDLENIIEGDIGIINNITTNIALDIAGRIINGQDVETMINGIEQSNSLVCKFIKSKKRKKVILTTCISGIGTAVKLRKLIKECIGNTDIEVKECEHATLKLRGRNDKIFTDYDVKLIISTTKLSVEGVDTILLEELMTGEKDKVLLEVLNDVIIDKNIDNIRQDLIKMFSMDNLISRMTILNPSKIINEVENVIINYEMKLGINFEASLKTTLYIHISILIERLMLKQELEFDKEDEVKYKEKYKKFIKISNYIFEAIANEYNLKIPTKEIHIIYRIIESRMGKIEL